MHTAPKTHRTHSDVLQGFVLHVLAEQPATVFSYEMLCEELADVFGVSAELGDGLRDALGVLVEAGLAKEARGEAWSATSAAVLARRIYEDI